MQGKIIKGIAGFYYVNVEGKGIFECNAKGAFRKSEIKPLVGDDCEIDIINGEDMTGNVVDILERKCEMIRPACANVDQAVIIFSIKTPDPNFNLLDRFLMYMDHCGVDCSIIFNKDDLANADEIALVRDTYKGSGYKLLFVSVRENDGIDEVRDLIKNKTTVVAGPSGVGKSSLINLLCENEVMETGRISYKTERGRHTTRHSELIYVGDSTYIMDTPGFSSLNVFGYDCDTLKFSYREFEKYAESCRFRTCVHVNEPGCAVKQAVENGEISKIRYENYLSIYNELLNARKW